MTIVSRTILSVGIYALVACGATAQEARRENAPHVHGSGNLGIVIEGNMIQLDLDTPAHDLIGFEHKPETAEQKATADRALKLLKEGTSLFSPSKDAGCTLASSEAEFESPEPSATNAAKKEDAQHADINAKVVFECKSINKLTAIDFGYFKAFPGAEKLAITLVTGKKQAAFDVTKTSPRLEISATK